ncbi:GAF domain-containing protein [Cryptosporangium phraense]|uniref:GAF domain-containing protein n=1 Tax=Cryptosporangium phraense TaxID=2593070 RepID=A0A545AQQ1_9ACTN|nr:GAF domain-containing protein [Cryptosporangium phraense]TQS43648.1 GAF domain-containing protein [Cryptosporangium phraense]
MSSPWLAWPSGADPSALRRKLHAAHESFLSTGDAQVRPVVLESWRRSVRSGVDPSDPAAAPPRDVLAYREQHPLAAVMPVVRELLVSDAAEADLLVAVADDGGQLLWVEGEPGLRARAAEMSFVEGSVWSEERVGTNAPGTALALDHPVQIFAAEHFSQPVQAWSCSAAPVHDPATGRVLGVLDVTGGHHVAAPQALTLVRAAAAAAEAQLRLQQLEDRRRRPTMTVAGPARLRVLGEANGGRFRVNGTEHRLSLRHTELLLALAQNPAGLTGEQLAVALSDGESALVTIRAEMSRLRRLLGPGVLASRPYRLTTPVQTDLDELVRLLRRGAHRQALAHYRGPVLPRSDAPFVIAAREETRLRVRHALLRHAGVDVLLQYAETAEGQDDVEVWAACLLGLPIGSPRRARILAHLERLERRMS